MTTLCDACGKPVSLWHDIGSTTVCYDCESELTERIAARREAGKPVNVKHLARAMLRETACGPETYILKDIPTELLTWAKAQPEDLRALILGALYEQKAKREESV